ncbi:MAG TPA: type II toxin-antitoxin system Phd/YefM family antitoxin [Candidatus Elarobacter sp.]|nr:type II toxin-antitoxin system Phd/YefM family antitoxin [Candidatus Elarobacter sp.]
MHVKTEWQLQDAKANLSQLVNRALEEGPQRITRHGRGAAVVLSERDYDRLIARTRGSLSEFLARSPLRGVPMDVRDHADTGREVDF